LPKITFFNLPDDKKRILIQAAKKEFSRVPLTEASISNIIKSAEIPRGSFYQYFEDKEDAFFYLLDEFTKEKKIDFVTILIKHDGDLFDGIVEFFDRMIKEKENLSFLRNAFLNMTYKIESIFDRMISDTEIKEKFVALSTLINTEQLNLSDDQELFHVLQILLAVTFRNLIRTFAGDVSYQVAMDNYMLEINLLKKGLCAKKALMK
jgi:AcrR family transcriptional regulator